MLGELQTLLGNIYEAQTAHDIHDYLITDPALARLYEGPHARATDEKVLIEQRADGVDIAVYLNGELLETLAHENPFTSLHEGNLGAFLTVLEGVSHFNYLAWNVPFDRGVSLLELEMQAEVDKFVAAVTLMSRQRDGFVPKALHARLFDDQVFDPNLNGEERERYLCANEYAGRYCLQLQTEYLLRRPRPGLLNELRRFYRLPQNAKIRRILG